MNGAQKRTKHIWKGLRGKKYRYLTVAILCVSLIMAASMLMLYLGGQKDERRYQSESYEMLEPGEPKLPWPSTSVYRIDHDCAIRTNVP